MANQRGGVNRPEHFSGWAGFEAELKKFFVISGRKNPTHDHPTGRVGPQFSGWARVGPGLGRAARAFYSVKQLKQHFGPGSGQKTISRASRSLPKTV
jgi:hypothetical protein